MGSSRLCVPRRDGIGMVGKYHHNVRTAWLCCCRHWRRRSLIPNISTLSAEEVDDKTCLCYRMVAHAMNVEGFGQQAGWCGCESDARNCESKLVRLI